MDRTLKRPLQKPGVPGQSTCPHLPLLPGLNHAQMPKPLEIRAWVELKVRLFALLCNVAWKTGSLHIDSHSRNLRR